MAPSPENNNAPKAPDKSDKSKCDGQESVPRTRESSAVDGDSKEASVSCLDDGQLKALLDEAINYKSPKDRQGKSILFNSLLTEAEDDLRNARATSASGPDIVRYCNTSARRLRNRKQPSSISENLTHGGSLNNLAKEELYEPANQLQRPKKTVSTRQREGGSLPCNVNVGCSYDRQFFEETYRRKEKQKPEYTSINMETDSLLEHDVLNQNSMESEMESMPMIPRLPTKYTTNAKIEISGVDDRIPMPSLERGMKSTDSESVRQHSFEPAPQRFSLLTVNGQNLSIIGSRREDKKVDENCNAVSQSNLDAKKMKKGRKAMDKNVVVLESSQVMGHRGDIINDVDKLIDYIDGNEDQSTSKSKSNLQKSHKLHKNLFDDGKGTKKQRTRSKAKGSDLQKSNSLEEISTTKLEDFSFSQEEGKVTLRPTKSNADRPRERRSWGNTEQIQLQNLQLYANASAENLESADFRVVTKKKKSKKSRSSLSGRRQAYSREAHVNDFNRVPSPEPRRKSAISVPHSEKSNDSSDVDSVHSLPIDTDRLNLDRLDCEDNDGLNFPISYADIAKNSALERSKWSRPPSEQKRSSEKNKSADRYMSVTSSESDSSKNEVVLEKPQKTKQSPESQQEKIKCKQQTVQTVVPVQNVSQGVQTSPKLQLNTTPPVAVEHVEKATSVTVIRSPPESIYVSYIQNFPSIPSKEKSPILAGSEKVRSPPEGNFVQSWPSITTSKVEKVQAKNNVSPNQKATKNTTNNLKNIKNTVGVVAHRSDKVPNMVSSAVKVHSDIDINEAQVIPHNNQPVTVYTYQNMPLNIPDVRTIEKMHFKQMHNYMPTSSPPYMQNCAPEPIMNHQQFLPPNNVQFVPKEVPLGHYKMAPVIPAMVLPPNSRHEEQLNSSSGGARHASNDFNDCGGGDAERTTYNRPAVVILSGNADKEVSGITFGFDINEQLLSDDVCADFLARFIVPKYCDVNGFNHDKIVNFIGIAWEDVISENNGKVKYYSEEL